MKRSRKKKIIIILSGEKMLKFIIWVIALVGQINAASNNSSLSGDKKMAGQLAKQLQINYKIIGSEQDPLVCQRLGAQWSSCYRSSISLKNVGWWDMNVTKNPFALIVPTPRRILAIVETEKFTVEHLTGDLYKLQTTPTFGVLKKGESMNVTVVSEFWAVADSDTFPRWMVEVGGAWANIENTDTDDVSQFAKPLTQDQMKRVPTDANVPMNASTRFDAYNSFTYMDADAARKRIIPKPALLSDWWAERPASIKNGVYLNSTLPEDNTEVMETILKDLGLFTSWSSTALKVEVTVNPSRLDTHPAMKQTGGYTMTIGSKGVFIYGYDIAGAMYGFSSLISLVNIQDRSDIPPLMITDAPRFEYRGFMLDIARNFHSKSEILSVINQMYLLKLNKFHLHLTDDEGWRIEIPGLSELTEIGGVRLGNNQNETIGLSPQLGHGTEKGPTDGFLSKSDFIEILEYATARNVQVIPEIDMPAHSRAAVMAMEVRHQKLSAVGNNEEAERYRLLDPEDTSNVTTVQYYNRLSFINMCRPSALAFVDKVMMEISAMYGEAGAPKDAWHFGGDEAKNIFLGNGFTSNTSTTSTALGIIDQSQQDKPYAQSPICKFLLDSGKVKTLDELPVWFAVQANYLAKQHGFQSFQTWQDGLKHLNGTSSLVLPTAVNEWNALIWGGVESATEWSVNRSLSVILSTPDYLYFDFPYEVDSAESGYYWASRDTNLKKIFSFAPVNLAQNAETSLNLDGNPLTFTSPAIKPNISGISAHLWSEVVRTDSKVEYMLYPRIFALAERAWSKPEWELDFVPHTNYSSTSQLVNKALLNADFNTFVLSLGSRQLVKLDKMRIEYRIPMAGAKVQDNILYVAVEVPGVRADYQLDEKSWVEYKSPVNVTNVKKIDIRTASFTVSGGGDVRYSRVQTLSL